MFTDLKLQSIPNPKVLNLPLYEVNKILELVI